MDMGKEIVSRVADQIINPLMESAKHHCGYLICYKKKIQELESEIGTLKDEKTRIQGRVDRAKDCGEIIEDDVSNWLKEVQNMEVEVGKFLEDKVKENKKCFKCWCPHLTWRYRLGEGAEKKKATVISLKDKGCKFETLPVSHPAPYPEKLQFASSQNYMNFESRARVFNGIMGALTDSEVNLIGVHGPGGAGKTTLVEEAAQQAKKDGLFDEIVMAVVSKDANVRKIQEELAPKLNLTYKEDNEVGRKGQLWNRLEGGNKKILAIMDDVWQQLNMEEIGIPIADGGRGCKVLLTTRREGVCQKMEVQKDFPIGVLKEQEAWSLFKKVVGNVPAEVTRSKAEEVCEECGGLPVAIVAVGAALKGKQGHVWDDALNQLKNSVVQEIPDIDPKMYTSLKWSYDYLEHEDAKSCFLLCCLFPEDANIPIEDLVRYCMALRLLRHAETLEKARSRVQAMVDLLKSSYLLLTGKDENFVKMHDVIRDIAISITSGKQEGQQWPNKQRFLVKHGVQKWPEEGTWELYTAVSIRAENIYELPGDLQCPELHTLLLKCAIYDLADLQLLPDSFFNGMKKLTVLRLPEDILSLPSSFTNLVNLRMLQASDRVLGDIGIIKNLKKNLEILILGDYNIVEMAPEIGELTRLRLLDLEECYNLQVIPQGVISKLIRLEELYISQQFDQWEGSTTSNKEKSNVSLAELKSLKQLTTVHIHIPDGTLLPNDLSFENLIRFQISVGEIFDYLDLYSSRTLKLVGFRPKAMFNVLINRAEVLCLRELEGLETLFRETHDGRVSNLKYLKIIDCHDLEYLLDKPEWLFSKLTEVVIKDCRRLKYLWSSFCAKRLLQLRRLCVGNCENMEGIVEIEKETDEEEPENMMIAFNQLREMKLERLPKLISLYPETKKTIKENLWTTEQSLFNEKVVFPALRELWIEDLPNADIWSKWLLPISEKVAKSFCQLKVMTIKKCNKVANVIPSNMFRQLQNLERLYIVDCNSAVSLVEELNTDEIKFPQLLNLELKGLPNFKRFKISKFEAQSLTNHQIVFPKLKYFSAANLASLREIHVGPVVTGIEGSLEEVRLEGFDHITLVSSPHLMQRFISLHKLVLTNCRLKVRQPFDLDGPNGEEGQVEPRIEVELLILNRLSESACFWEKDPLVALALRNLKFLTVCNCSILRNLFTNSVASSLNQLLTLAVRSCKLMEEVVTDKGEDEAIDGVNIQFHKLTFLWLDNLPNLESFCSANYNFNFPSLILIEVRGCPKMQTFTSEQAKLRQEGIIYNKAEDQYFWIRDLNKCLKEEEIAMTPADVNRALEELSQENFSDLDEFLDEILSDTDGGEPSESEADTE